MENEDNKDSFSEDIEKAKRRDALYRQIVNELQSEERYLHYFKQFSPSSVELFINYYAADKVLWYELGDSFARYRKTRNERWHELALELFISLKIKKVYNAAARWANYEIQIPGIKSYYQFDYWLHHPFACPFVQPVQPHELETAIRFVQSLDNEQNFRSMCHTGASVYCFGFHKELIDCDPYDYPLFHQFWDKIYNTEYLMCKVPLRVKKEEDYIDLAIDSEIKHTPPNEETIPARQKKSLNGYDKNFLEKFIKTFESSENRDMYKAEQWWDSKREFSEMINDEMSCLHETPKNTPVESNDDWREALLSTADYYVRDQVIAWLPQIYEEYIDRQKNNDSFEDWKTGNGMVYGEWYEKRLQQILTGRKLKNEPEDFNF